MNIWKSSLLTVVLLAMAPVIAWPAESKDKAEAEGKVVFYTTANTTDAKAMGDSFKKIYPKIDVEFYRSTDSQLMEKILNEARAGESFWDVVSTTGFYGYLLKKRGMLSSRKGAYRVLMTIS